MDEMNSNELLVKEAKRVQLLEDIRILEHSKNLEEAIKKLEALLNK